MVNPDSPDLAYVQVADLLATRIRAGDFPGRMPAERELAQEYEVSYGTVRRAMKILRERDLVRSVHGRGTFAVG